MVITTLKDKRICIVDDNAQNIYILLMLLKQHGAHGIVGWWADGEIHRLVSQLPLDMILLDLMLPGGRTGYDLIAQIKSVPALAHIPVVAVSAQDASVAIPETRARGFAGFIGKPVNDILFPEQITAVLNGQPVWSFH